MEPAKRCSQCGELKPLTLAYYFDEPRVTDGFSARCRACANEYNRQYRQRAYVKVRDRLRMREHSAKHREEIRARDRQRYRDGKMRRKGYWEHPEKSCARALVYKHILRGKMTKPTECQRCGTSVPPRRLHAHHHDYSRPLDVEWLCSTCHGKEHRIAC